MKLCWELHFKYLNHELSSLTQQKHILIKNLLLPLFSVESKSVLYQIFIPSLMNMNVVNDASMISHYIYMNYKWYGWASILTGKSYFESIYPEC